MTYWPLLLILLPLGLVLLLIAARLLFRRGWIGGFLRGLVGLGCLVFLTVLGLLVFDLSAYRALSRESVVATISFSQLADQTFDAQVAPASSDSSRIFELKGDEWQVDARILTWKGPLAVLGMEPVYRLDRLGGRYHDLEQERSAERTVHALDQGDWISIRRLQPWLPWIDARYGSAAYLPMVDGGIFDVSLTARGIIARPVNEPARDAVDDWASE